MEETTRICAASPANSIESLQPFEHALKLLLTHRGNPSVEIERLLDGDPESVRGHCLRAALIVYADDVARRQSLAQSVAAIEAACPDIQHPARCHAAAARSWLEGDSALAVKQYGSILIDWPRDILALVVAHALDFRLGQPRMLRDRVARVLPKWDTTAPHYASVLAMYAFGLEENGEYRQAEKIARRALAIDSGHPGAIHVIAHVMEMQGRAREGLNFLAETESAWLEGTGFSVHLAWHRALLYLDMNDAAAALAIYDTQIAATHAPGISVLADASSLLWRMKIGNIDVGTRWDALADRWETQTLTHARPFYVVHAMMAFSAARRGTASARLVKALRGAKTTADSGALPEEALALPLSEALLAFARGDFAASVDWLKRVRRLTHRCGGSLAQCDIIHLTLTEAALRARNDRLAEALVTERTLRKPESWINRILQRRLQLRAPQLQLVGLKHRR